MTFPEYSYGVKTEFKNKDLFKFLGDKMRALIRFFASNHLLANLVVFAILGLGIVTLMNLKRDIYKAIGSWGQGDGRMQGSTGKA